MALKEAKAPQLVEGDSDVIESTRAAHAYQTAAPPPPRGRSVSREPPRAAGTHASSDLKRSSDGAHEETVLTRTRVDAVGGLRTLAAAFVCMNTRRTAAAAAAAAALTGIAAKPRCVVDARGHADVDVHARVLFHRKPPLALLSLVLLRPPLASLSSKLRQRVRSETSV